MNNIKFRPATLDDNLRQIARLIFQSNTEVYRLWRPTEQSFAQFIEPWFCVEGFLYHYKNLCIATEYNDRFPLAVIAGLDSKPKPHFNYETYFDDKGSEFVISQYIKDILSVRAFLPESETIITAFCVEPAVRGYGLGQELLEYYMRRMQKRGSTAFRLDFNTNNQPMTQLCEKRGFRQIGEKINHFDSDGSNIATYTI